jgi:uncharacterized glyoxalase superfamily protein PhnB
MAKKRPKAKARKAAPRKAKKVEAVPARYGSVTPALTVRGGSDAIAFYQKAFGARELSRMPGPGGKLMHAEIKIGDSIVMLSDEFPEMGSRSPLTVGGTSTTIMLYVKDVDAAFRRAVEAGATVTMPLADQFWGDRYGGLVDPFGHQWALATHKEDLSPKEMMRRMEAFMARQPPPQG